MSNIKDDPSIDISQARTRWAEAMGLRGEPKHDLFELRQSVVCGIEPLQVGFIITLKYPRSFVWFDSGNRFNKSFKTAETAIFNQEYGFGGYTGYVRVIDNEKNWQEELFKVCVDRPPKGGLITSFSQTKAAGHVAIREDGRPVEGTGLDVSLAITRSGSGTVYWNFDDDTKEPNGKDTTSHRYEKEGTFNGSVTVTGNGKDSRNFPVIIKEFRVRKNLSGIYSTSNEKSSAVVIYNKD